MLFVFVSASLFCTAQKRTCGTNVLPHSEEENHAQPKDVLLKLEDLPSGVITIPVVVHVIHHDASSNPKIGTSSNISDNQIYSQIRVLNEDFRRKQNTNGFNTWDIGADVEIEFCLASYSPTGEPTTGINRVYNSKTKWKTTDDRELKSLIMWPNDSYLNIWVTELEGVLGYARYPVGTSLYGIADQFDESLDGVVIDHRAFGTNGSATYLYNLGRTATHEIGHWFGLLHVWGGNEGDVCGDDYVQDTPWDEGPNNDTDCTDSSTCTGESVADITSNYLDFSNDRCMNLFTKGQKQRMLQAIAQSPSRNKILSSQGCALQRNDDFKVIIFPVPAKNILTIQTQSIGYDEVEILIRDYNGRIIFESKFDFTFQTDCQLNVSDFKNGFYVMKIRKDGQEKLFKFVVSH